MLKFIKGILYRLGLALAVTLSPVAVANPLLGVAAAGQDLELLLLPEVTSDKAALLREDFAFLQAQKVFPPHTLLKVKAIPHLAQTLDTDLVVVAESLGSLPRLQRLLVLAHEASHVRHNDREQARQLLESHVPGYLPRDEARARLREVEPEFKALAHAQEFRADRQALESLGQVAPMPALKNAFRALLVQYPSQDSLTHPASRARVQQVLGAKS